MKFFVLALLIGSNLFAAPVGGAKIQKWDRHSSYFLSAPHGDFDINTDKIVEEICNTVPWDCLVAIGYRTGGHQFNVNRPTEGVAADDERSSDEAMAVYQEYQKAIQSIAPETPRIYVEIHGNINPLTAKAIEVATHGISDAAAKKLKSNLVANIRSAGIDDIDVHMEPLDTLHYKASSSKRIGILKVMPISLHIELPLSLRRDDSAVKKTVSILAPFLNTVPDLTH